jgi:pantoate--beta-alanine ligase
VSLERFTTIAGLRQHLDDLRYGDDASIGLVPTMGALHEGHASLIAQAADDNHEVIITIFVNPLQFGANEDLATYPRDLETDAAIAEAAGATILFAPTVEEMYPFGPAKVLTSVSVRALTDVLDGVSRPGHFDGVATVVAKLFAIAGPCDAYFGEKDYQQLAVIRRMATDLSSRNRYLTADERDGAAIIYRALQAGAKAVAEGNSGKFVETAVNITLPFGNVVKSVDYVSCVDPLTLESVETITSEVRLLIAVRVGTTRLIDNCAAFPQPKRSK